MRSGVGRCGRERARADTPRMPVFAVYEQATGRLVSTGDTVADPLPAGLAVKQIAKQPDQDDRWDEATLGLVAVQHRDRIADLLADAGIAGMSAANKRTVQDAVTRIFGQFRYYDA